VRNSLRMLIIIAFLLAQTGTAVAQTIAPNASLCVPRGYAVVFFNGVFNSFLQAGKAKEIVKSSIGSTYGPSSEPVIYRLAYNTSGSQSGSPNWEDLAETYQQRANAIDPTGNLAKHVEILWELLNGRQSFINRIILIYSGSQSLLQSLASDIRAKAVGALGYLTSNPPTAADYARSDNQLDDLAAQGQKILLVAHSQGNLFLNHAYEHIVGTVGARSIAAVHVAPASTSTHGPYFLSSSDHVINQLLSLGGGTVLSPNITMPDYDDDWSGHQFKPTYMNSSKPARSLIVSGMRTSLSSLVAPTVAGNVGAFTVTLTWDGPGDVDLHVVEPSGGSHVYYASRLGIDGSLDKDNIVANGPEHYYSTCDSSVLQPGIYSIGLNNFHGATGRTATVQVSSTLSGFNRSKQLGVGPERGSSGDSSPLPVFNLTVTKDPNTGKFSYAVN